MKKNILKTISLAVVLLLCSAFLFSCSKSAPEGDYVSDSASVLSESDRENLKSVSDSLFESKGIRLAVSIVSDTGSETMKTCAERIYKSLEIEYGVLVLLSTGDSNYYAVQNKQTSDYLPDSDFSEIVKSGMEAPFSEGNYAEAVSTTFASFRTFFESHVNGTLKSGGSSAGTVILVIIIILAVLIGGGYAALRYLEKRNERLRRERMMRRQGRGPSPYGDPRNRRPGGMQNGGRRPPVQNGADRGQAPRGPVARQRVDSDMRNAATVTINSAALKRMRNSDSDSRNNNYR